MEKNKIKIWAIVALFLIAISGIAVFYSGADLFKGALQSITSGGQNYTAVMQDDYQKIAIAGDKKANIMNFKILPPAQNNAPYSFGKIAFSINPEASRYLDNFTLEVVNESPVELGQPRIFPFSPENISPYDDNFFSIIRFNCNELSRIDKDSAVAFKLFADISGDAKATQIITKIPSGGISHMTPDRPVDGIGYDFKAEGSILPAQAAQECPEGQTRNETTHTCEPNAAADASGSGGFGKTSKVQEKVIQENQIIEVINRCSRKQKNECNLTPGCGWSIGDGCKKIPSEEAQTEPGKETEQKEKTDSFAEENLIASLAPTGKASLVVALINDLGLKFKTNEIKPGAIKAPVGAFTVENKSSIPSTISKIKIFLANASASDTLDYNQFDAIYLYKDGVILPESKELVLESNTFPKIASATWDNLNIDINDHATVNFGIAVSLKSMVESNKTFGFSLSNAPANPSFVASNANIAFSTGAQIMNMNTFKVAQETQTAAATATTPAPVTIENDPAFMAKNITKGQRETVASFIVKNNSAETIYVNKIKLEKDSPASGAANELPDAAVKNFRIMKDNTEIYDSDKEITVDGLISWPFESTIASNTVIFNLDPGAQTKISISALIDENAQIGKKFRFKINTADVKYNGTSNAAIIPSAPLYTPELTAANPVTSIKIRGNNELTDASVQPYPTTSSIPIFSFDIQNKSNQTIPITKVQLYNNFSDSQTIPNTDLLASNKLIDLTIYKGNTSVSEDLADAATPTWGASDLTFSMAPNEAAKITIKATLVAGEADNGKKFTFGMTNGSIEATGAKVIGLDPGSRLLGPVFTVSSAPQTPETTNPQLTISPATDTPQALAKTAGSIDWFEAARLQFTATNRIEIDSITVTSKQGLGDFALPLSKIEKVRLFTSSDGTTKNQLGSEQSASGNGFTFAFLDGKWILNAPALSQKLIIEAKLAPDADIGKKFALGLASTANVHFSTTGAQIANTTFPVMGNEITISMPGQTETTTTTTNQDQLDALNQQILDLQNQLAAANTTQDSTQNDERYNALNEQIAALVEQINAQRTQETQQTGQTPTCEELGLFTYTGPESPGVRTAGMCIQCPTNTYIQYGGKCEPERQIVAQNTPMQTQETVQTPPTQQRPAAGAPELSGTSRLARAPERGAAGPGVAVYFGILGLIQGGIWLKRKLKK